MIAYANIIISCTSITVAPGNLSIKLLIDMEVYSNFKEIAHVNYGISHFMEDNLVLYNRNSTGKG